VCTADQLPDWAVGCGFAKIRLTFEPSDLGVTMFGCGGDNGLYHLSDEIMESVADVDRLERADELVRDRLGEILEARRVSRRQIFRTAGALAFASAASASFAEITAAHPLPSAPAGAAATSTAQQGRTVTIPSTPENIRLGQFDSTLPDIDTVDSGDVILYPDTLPHFLGRLQKGTPIEEIAQMRRDNPGKGPHTIVGPVGVRDAAPGDVLECRFQRLLPIDWGVNFNNPGDLGTGALPQEFPQGQVKYFDLNLDAMTTEFTPGVTLPLAPFQGTFGVAPKDGGVVSSVPPGQHAGNVDLRDQNEGSTLWIPVWQPGAKIFTGDSHVLQGDGEVNLTAVESAMREVRVQVILHQNVGWEWPFADTNGSTMVFYEWQEAA
jgi:acetamidase/formamidase